MKSKIEAACDSLKQALLAEYEASQHELNSKVAKQKAHAETLYARDVIREFNFY